MKISAIRQQVRRNDRYSVYVDDKYSFSLSERALLESKIVSGQELDEAQIAVYKQLSADDKLYDNALRFAAMRLRSRWELEQYLIRKEADPESASLIIERLSDLGFIDDRAFARAWVENRHLLRPTSKRKLRQELLAKRVAESVIDEILRLDETADSHELQAIIERKRRQSRYQDDTKLMQYLARQGFGYDDIKQAIG